MSASSPAVVRQIRMHSNEVAEHPDHLPARRTGVRRAVGWVLFLASLLAAVAAMLARRFYYGNDDLLQFFTARDRGLSWDLLSLNVFQHFGPYNRIGHWFVYRFSDLSPALGLTLVLAHLAALLAAALWLMTELRLSPPRRVVALILIALSVSLTESAVWFDAGMHILPAIAITLAVCAAHVRGVHTGARRWHGLALVLFLLGLLVQERPLFALPMIVLVDLLLLWRDLPWRERLRRLWGLRRPIGVMVVVATAIAAALRAFVIVGSLEPPSWTVTLRTMLSALTNFVVPAVVNQPRSEPGGLAVQLAVLAGLVLLGVALARMRHGNAGPVLFAAAVFVMYFGFLKFSPLLNEHTITVNAARLNNAVYVTVPATIALVDLRGPAHLRRSAVARRWRSRSPGVRRGLQVAACAGLAVYLLLSNIGYLDRHWADTTRARAYLDAVRTNADIWSDPDVTLVPLNGHPAMAQAWSAPLGRQETLLTFVRKGFHPGDVGGRTVLIDDRGTVRSAVLETVRPNLQIVDGGCSGSAGPRFDDADLALSRIREEPLFVRLQYRADQDLQLLASAGWGHAWHPNGGVSTLAAGAHTRLIPIDADRLALVDLQRTTPAGAGFCVQHADVVRALLVEDGGLCREIDRYGRPRAVLDCPSEQRGP